MRTLGKTKGLYQSTVPNMLKSKEIADQERMMWNQAKMNDPSMEIGWSPRNAEGIYDANLSPQDMSRMVSGQKLAEVYGKQASNFAKMFRGAMNGQTVSYHNLINEANKVSASFANQVERMYQYGLQYGNPDDAMQMMLNELKNNLMETTIGGYSTDQYGRVLTDTASGSG